MLEPPDVKHAMDVAKKQSNVSPSSHSLRAHLHQGVPHWCVVGWAQRVATLISISGGLKYMVVGLIWF